MSVGDCLLTDRHYAALHHLPTILFSYKALDLFHRTPFESIMTIRLLSAPTPNGLPISIFLEELKAIGATGVDYK